MPMIKKSITVTDKQESWIQNQLSTGQFSSDSEVIRDALRRVQKIDEQHAYIRAALEEGKQSGYTSQSPSDARLSARKKLGL